MTNRTLLLEIGLEEMPARFVTNAMNELQQRTEAWMKEHRLTYTKTKAFSTPRRLAVIVHDLDEKQDDVEEEAKGPSKKIAQDAEGNWSKAAKGFARGQGVNIDDLYVKSINGEDYVFAKKFTAGEPVTSLLPELKQVILSIPFPKNMKWGTNDQKFVRPVKWLVALYGTEVISFNITNVSTDRYSFGHRFLGSQLVLEDAKDYVSSLLKEHVIVDPIERKTAIRKQLEQMAESEGWIVPVDENLLEEVTNLVEYPTALYGTFDERFLKVPEEVLITSMREHQRYFPVKNKDGDLKPNFITVRNGDHRHLENVQKGNEKVLRARLADAEFFYHEDLNKNFESLFSRLESIVYHEELGSVADKVRRFTTLAVKIAEKAGATHEIISLTERAAHLSKNDLVTHMVNEFPELEGRMGEEYALKSGEDTRVARAIKDHYLPKQSGDLPPSDSIGAFISAADKIDTLVTSFGIGAIPTGSQDPHGLRRQTAAILHIFLKESWHFDLFEVMKQALVEANSHGLVSRSLDDVMTDLKEFVKLRYKHLLQEKNVRYDVAEAILASAPGRVDLTVNKSLFLMGILNDASFKKDVEAFNRVINIAKKATSHSLPDPSLFTEEDEKNLFAVTNDQMENVPSLLNKGEIGEAYAKLKQLVPVIHHYFDNIMVMAENETIKANRLAQMRRTSEMIISFADFKSIVFHAES
ncbi:glycine--tRNA ligase subunit beta [Salipaludibacillus sp. LMS25]|jgi:glycyl-tRNA synthetase beta chain|uniref:glycine--tRNA ligase subunit beta n=1 Tax=Salipaludibacillus sp. LMS25 TaxID=2924031 RepID=UPI0020D007F5|nr:glycine--tRNA ligase subunit beta [Salipaludibacillus sp. LMS25]UTR14384.1 glycine--tRNA ligase subunit beta [Salipaludibacillus sp. LMS25]